jgi:hypothetical protein
MKPTICATETGLVLGVVLWTARMPLLLGAEPRRALERTGGTIMRGNLEKRGPAPFRSAVLAFLLVGGLLLLMLLCGWLYAGTSGAVITTVLGAIALMLVRKVSPQFVLLLSGARLIDSA